MRAELDCLLDGPVHALGRADTLHERDRQRALGAGRDRGEQPDGAGLRVCALDARVETRTPAVEAFDGRACGKPQHAHQVVRLPGVEDAARRLVGLRRCDQDTRAHGAGSSLGCVGQRAACASGRGALARAAPGTSSR
ncbi:MAG: hypothetical protein M5U30_15440 [Burkholderiaceae bacterium]|nr:hypothetical protein [Burkholderiaceae bacterium]